tara:strand:+ start:4496 stop:4675 length:180 start_codon:yes stop_codon:yes gene_type:complete
MAIIDQNKESLKQREQRIGYLRDKLDKLVEDAEQDELEKQQKDPRHDQSAFNPLGNWPD